MKQRFTSANTSINSAKLPAVYKKATFSAPIVLDYGCGKYTEHIRRVIPEGVEYLPYDPFNQADDVNRASLRKASKALETGKPVDVVCSNVLNVIDDDDTVRSIAGVIEWYVTRSGGGTAYVTVYEGDRSGRGRQTGVDQYQRNETLRSYLRFFRAGKIKNGMIVING